MEVGIISYGEDSVVDDQCVDDTGVPRGELSGSLIVIDSVPVVVDGEVEYFQRGDASRSDGHVEVRRRSQGPQVGTSGNKAGTQDLHRIGDGQGIELQIVLEYGGIDDPDTLCEFDRERY